MPFDIQGARAAGYSDTDIASYLTQQHPQFDVQGARKAGYGDSDIVNFLQDYKPPPTSNAGMDILSRIAHGVGEIPGNILRAGDVLQKLDPGAQLANRIAGMPNEPIGQGYGFKEAKGLEGILPQGDPARNNQFPAQAADFLGGLGGLIGTSMIPGVGIPMAVASGGGGAAQSGLQAAQAAGATPAQQQSAAMANAIIQGPLQAFPAGRLAGRFGQQATDTILQSIIKSAAENAAVSGAGQAASNTVARTTYNPNQNILEGVPQAAAIGGLTGGVLGGVAGAVSRPGRVRAEQLATDQATQLDESAQMIANQQANAPEGAPPQLALPAPNPADSYYQDRMANDPGRQAAIQRAQEIDQRAAIEPTIVDMVNSQRQAVLDQAAQPPDPYAWKGESQAEEPYTWTDPSNPEPPTVPPEAKVDPTLVPNPDPFSKESYNAALQVAKENGSVSVSDLFHENPLQDDGTPYLTKTNLPHLDATIMMNEAVRRGDLVPGWDTNGPTLPIDERTWKPSFPENNLTESTAPTPTPETTYAVKEIPVTGRGNSSSYAVVERTPTPGQAPHPDGAGEPAMTERPVQAFPTQEQAQAKLDELNGVTRPSASPTDPKQDQLFYQLRSRLRGLGLDDKVALDVRSNLTGRPDTLSEGDYNPANRVISLARDIYDPNISDSNLTDKLSGVMDHESVHAMRDMGLLNDSEWDTLSKEVGNRKYQRGDQQREYTYLDWAQQNHPDLTPEQTHEEAVADMFRQWVASGAKPNARYTGILSKLGNSLRAITRTVGKSDRVLDSINKGEVGARPVGERPVGRTSYSSRRITPEQYASIMSAARASRPTPLGLGDRELQDRQAMEVMEKYTGLQDNLSKALGKIPGLNQGSVRDWMDNATRLMQNQFFPVARFMNDMRGLGASKFADTNDALLSINKNAGAKGAQLKSAAEKLYAPAVEGVHNIKATEGDLNSLRRASPMVDQIIAGIKNGDASMKIAQTYFMAKHAQERNEFIARTRQTTDPDGTVKQDGSGISTPEAQKILDWFAGYSKMDKVQQAQDKLQAMIADTRRVRTNAGLTPDYAKMSAAIKDEIALVSHLSESPENDANVASLTKMLDRIPQWDNYVPLRGKAGADPEEDYSPMALQNAGMRVRGLEDPHAYGRSSVADDIMLNSIYQHEAAVIRAQNNDVGQRLGTFIRDNADTVKDWATIHESLPLTRGLDANGKTIMRPDNSFANDKNVFTYKDNGKNVYVEFHGSKGEQIADALNNVAKLGTDPFGTAIRWISKPMQAMRMLATGVNPQFAPKNFARDWQEATSRALEFSPKASAYIAANNPKNLAALIAGDADTKVRLGKLGELGGLTGGYTARSPDKILNDINHQVATLGKTQTPVQRAISMRKWMEHRVEGYNSLFEGATRLTVYDAFKDQGYSDERAAQMAKDMTVNFDMKGKWTPYINGMYLFANAGTQGMFGMAKAMATSKAVRMAVAGMVAGGFANAALNDGMDSDDKKYSTMRTYIKDHNYIIMAPGTKDGYYKIPKMQAFGIFDNIGRRIYEVSRGQTDPLHAILSTLGDVSDQANPLNDSNVATMALPTIARPLVEAYNNSAWTGNPIHPDDTLGINKAASQSYFEDASPAARASAAFLSKSTGGDGEYGKGLLELHPNDIDYVLSSYLGGVGRTFGEAANLMDFGAHKADREAQETQPTPKDIPFVRDFYGTIGQTGNRQAYQEATEPYMRMDRSMQAAQKDDDPDAYSGLMQRYGEKIPQIEMVKSMESQRSSINRDLQKIQKDAQIPAGQKVQMVNSLRDEENQIMGATMTQLRQMNAPSPPAR